MALYFVLTAQESSAFLGNRPSADAIWNALQTATLPSATRWIGPLARITRRNERSFRPWKTDVTWVLEIERPYSAESARTIAQDVSARVDIALSRLSSDWSHTSVEPYDARKEGPLASWNPTPRHDHTGIVVAEDLAHSGEQVGRDAAQFLERVGSGVGAIAGGTVAGALNPLKGLGSTLLAVVTAAAVVVVAVKFWPARKNPIVARVM